MKEIKRNLCSTTAYLIGVKERNFFASEGKCGLLKGVFEELDRQTHAQIIRDLCIIRSYMILNNGRIQKEFCYSGHNIYTLEKIKTQNGEEIETLPHDVLNRLYHNGVNIYMNRPDVYGYLILINREVKKRLYMQAVKKLFPPAINWEYICDIFLFPSEATEKNVLRCVEDYFRNRKQYPYGCYINWDGCNGKILKDDDEFLQCLYERHEDCWRVWGDGEFEPFLGKNEKVYAIVDCATTDIAAFEAMWQELGNKYIAHIDQILLLCPSVMRATWEMETDGMSSVELYEVGKENPPGGNAWCNILVDTVSDRLLTVNCPLLLLTGDVHFFQLLYDSNIIDTEFLIVTGRVYEADWIGIKQEAHLYLMPDIPTDYVDKAEIARKRILDHLAACQLPSLSALTEQAVMETPFAFTEEEQKRLYSECARNLTLIIDAKGNLRFQIK